MGRKNESTPQPRLPLSFRLSPEPDWATPQRGQITALSEMGAPQFLQYAILSLGGIGAQGYWLAVVIAGYIGMAVPVGLTAVVLFCRELERQQKKGVFR